MTLFQDTYLHNHVWFKLDTCLVVFKPQLYEMYMTQAIRRHTCSGCLDQHKPSVWACTRLRAYRDRLLILKIITINKVYLEILD